ncbi:MAG TPA: shikimate dehydrogenase [Jiangellaceae bacterium]|nr:shikimate dehydrogenase [Jiangellaceae bacterium]
MLTSAHVPPTMARCGVVGSPVAHSLSPVLHRVAYTSLGLEWAYEAVDVPAGELSRFLGGVGASWHGISVTMPLKREALALAGRASAVARSVGGANTLLAGHDGGWRADNTDVPGFLAALQAGGVIRPRQVVVWGAGATAASALAALAQLTPGVQVRLRARSPERAEPTLTVGRRLGLDVSYCAWTDDERSAEPADLVISTVPGDAFGPAEHEHVVHAAKPGTILFDVVYDPWPTPVAQTWAASGGSVISGLELLLHQAVGQVRSMTGHAVEVDVLRSAAHAELDRRRAPG